MLLNPKCAQTLACFFEDEQQVACAHFTSSGTALRLMVKSRLFHSIAMMLLKSVTKLDFWNLLIDSELYKMRNIIPM